MVHSILIGAEVVRIHTSPQASEPTMALCNLEHQKLRLLKLVANVFKAQDIPASNLAMCSVPWEHANLFPYNQPSLVGSFIAGG